MCVCVRCVCSTRVCALKADNFDVDCVTTSCADALLARWASSVSPAAIWCAEQNECVANTKVCREKIYIYLDR